MRRELADGAGGTAVTPARCDPGTGNVYVEIPVVTPTCRYCNRGLAYHTESELEACAKERAEEERGA